MLIKIKNFDFFKKPSNVIILITIFGVALRILKAFVIPDIDQDEGYTYEKVISHSLQELVTLKNFDYHAHPPLAYLVLKFWSFIVDTEYTIRIPNLCFSILSMYVFYKILNIIFSRNFTLKWSLYLYFCSSSFFVYYGVIYRNYSLGILMILTSMYLYLVIFKQEEAKEIVSFRRYFGLGLLVWFAFWTEYSAAWVFASIGIWAIFNKQYKRKSFYTLVISCVLMIPWIGFSVIANLSSTLHVKKVALPEFSSISDFLNVMAHFSDLRYLTYENFAFVYVMLLATLVSIIGMIRFKKVHSGLSFFLLISLLFPNVVVIFITIKYSPIFDYKHMWYSNLILVVGLHLFIFNLPEKIRKFALSLFVFIQLTTVFWTVVKYRNELGFHQTTLAKKVLAFVDETRGEKKALVVIPTNGDWSTTVYPYKHWYFNQAPIEIKEFDSLKMENESDKKIYYFDIENKLAPENIGRLSEKFQCSLKDQSLVLDSGSLFSCEEQPHE